MKILEYKKTQRKVVEIKPDNHNKENKNSLLTRQRFSNKFQKSRQPLLTRDLP